MDTTTHTLDAHPGWVEAVPKDPTEDNAFGFSRLTPEEGVCLDRSECADASVLPWETLVAMLEAAGYELKFARPVDPALKSAVLGLLKPDVVTVPKDIGPNFYNGPNTPGPSLQGIYDALFELRREGYIVEDMRDDGFMGYRIA
jgi:hypothetical protein